MQSAVTARGIEVVVPDKRQPGNGGQPGRAPKPGGLRLLASLAIAQNRPRFAFTTTVDLVPAAIAVDPSGNTYLTGQIICYGLMATPGAYQSQNNVGVLCPDGTGFGPPIISPCANAWVIKLDASGAIVFATYLGGTGDAVPTAIAVDAHENVYIAG
jgi:hypothetical protein